MCLWHDQGKWVACQKNSINWFLCHFLITSKCFILMQTPWQLDIWLQSYEWFDNAKNNEIWTLFLPISLYNIISPSYKNFWMDLHFSKPKEWSPRLNILCAAGCTFLKNNPLFWAASKSGMRMKLHENNP